MECPFCCSNLPPGSELCPNCMSDLRNANPRGDRGTATDAQTTGYIPPRKGYIPPTQPGSGAEGPSPLAAAPVQPGLPVHSAQAYAATAQAGFGAASPYAPNAPGYAPAYAAAPGGFAAAPPAVGTAVSPQPQPQPQAQLPPRQPVAPAPAGAAHRETERAGGHGRRETALDADGGGPQPVAQGQAPARGRTRLDRSDAPAVGAAAVPHRRVVGWMISFDVNEAGQEYLIREGRNTIGRAREADISIFYDEHVSGTHATIVYRNGEFKLRDEMTNNGTFVNGQDVGPGATVALSNGDVLRLGRCTFKVFLLDPQEVRRLWPRLAPSA